jgi:UDP-N-acetylglucosamine 2-epimerase (non-hydrolysing)
MTTPIKILTVFGTRPEAIKMAPVVHALAARPDRFFSRVCVTAQHREMLDQVLRFFCVRPDFDLDVMIKGQSPTDVIGRVVDRFAPVLRHERPDWVLVQGDTTTAMAAAMAANYWNVKVGHVEAGLRTFDKTQPFPEEINRVVVTSVADVHFAPTALARANLLSEGVENSKIFITGNPGIDALFYTLATLNGGIRNDPLAGLPEDGHVILVTAHRRESFGKPLESICRALLDIAARYENRVKIVYPVHPNSKVYDVVHKILGRSRDVVLLPPLDYRTLVHVIRRCDLVLSDSGGIQEEAPSIGKPVLVLRNITERPEGIGVGAARLVGTDRATIVEETSRLLENRKAYMKMAQPINVYGDGRAAPRIVSALLGEKMGEWYPEARRAN